MYCVKIERLTRIGWYGLILDSIRFFIFISVLLIYVSWYKKKDILRLKWQFNFAISMRTCKNICGTHFKGVNTITVTVEIDLVWISNWCLIYLITELFIEMGVFFQINLCCISNVFDQTFILECFRKNDITAPQLLHLYVAYCYENSSFWSKLS